MVERRDQVRTTFLSLRAFMPSILASKWPSMNAPFLVERPINRFSNPVKDCYFCNLTSNFLLRFFAPHNKLIRTLVVTRLVAACRLTPRRHRMTAAAGFAFTTAVRVIHRVHGHTAVMRLFAQPAVASRLADGNVFVIGISDLPDGGHAIDE